MFGLTTLGVFHTAIANADAPELQIASGVLLVAFLIGATLQVRRLRAERAA